MEDVCIDTFCDRLKPRVAIRTGVTWAKPDALERLGQIITHPMVVCYARVATAGMVGFIGLCSVCVLLMAGG